jgi:hypothetical protein
MIRINPLEQSIHLHPLRAQRTRRHHRERSEEGECEKAFWEHGSDVSGSEAQVGKNGNTPIAALFHALAKKEDLEILHSIRLRVQAYNDLVLQHLGLLPKIGFTFIDVKNVANAIVVEF